MLGTDGRGTPGVCRVRVRNQARDTREKTGAFQRGPPHAGLCERFGKGRTWRPAEDEMAIRNGAAFAADHDKS